LRLTALQSRLAPADDLCSALGHLQSAVSGQPSAVSHAKRPSANLSPAEEHTFLFHRQAHCPPYESSYYPAGLEQNLADIAGFYRAFGLRVAPEAHERVDHIGSQLEFVAVLCAKEVRALQNDLTEQAEICRAARRAFLADHLGRWAPAFAARVKDKARLPLYPALTEALMALLTREAGELGVTLHAALPPTWVGSAAVDEACPSCLKEET
jgi:TorA maturation chaperone TorD